MLKNRLKILSVLGIFLWALAIYWPSFRAPFELDDYFVIVTNPTVTQLNNLTAIWHWDPSRFLTYLTFAANFVFSAVKPFGYHVVNFVLHLLMVVLVYHFVRALLEASEEGRAEEKGKSNALVGKMALLAALIFLVHPIQTAAVTYVAQRSTLLASLFYLATLVLYLRHRASKSFLPYFAALLTAGLGIFSKPIIMTLPFALFLCEISFPKGSLKLPARILAILPFFLLVLNVPFLLLLMQGQSMDVGRLLDASRETIRFTRLEYLFTQAHVLWTYLRLLILPIGQNIDYDYAITHTLDLWTALCGLGILGLAGLAVWFWRRERLISFGIFWFLITLSVESSIFPISDVIFEHRLYLPLLGFALIVARLVLQNSSKRFNLVLFSSIMIVLSLLSFQRNQLWSDRINFLRDVTAKSPNKSRVHNSLALAYAEEGQYGPALASLQTAIERDPKNVEAYNNRANIYRITGQYALAIKEYTFIVEHVPNFAFGYFFRSQCYFAKGEYGPALADALRAREMGFPVAEEYIRQLKK